MADRFLVLQLGIAKILPAQPVPELFATDAAPNRMQLLPIERQQLFHGVDATLLQALFHARSYAGQIAGGQRG
jgi:hypothetical protein